MKVGTLQETVTVTGEAPLVDVQSSVLQQIINRDLLDVLPSGRMCERRRHVPGHRRQRAGCRRGVGIQPDQDHGARLGRLSDRLRRLRDGTEHHGPANGSACRTSTNGMAQEDDVPDERDGRRDVLPAGVRREHSSRRKAATTSAPTRSSGTIPNRRFSSSNLDENIIKRGLTTQPTLLVARDFNQSIGGPVAKDRNLVLRHLTGTSQQQRPAPARSTLTAEGRGRQHAQAGPRPRDVAGERESTSSRTSTS